MLFKDAAAVFGAATASVILTGMGSDGTNGARALVEAGGPVLAQDEATSTVWACRAASPGPASPRRSSPCPRSGRLCGR